MSSSTSASRHEPIPFAGLIVAWLLGLISCVAGMLDLVGEWNPQVATVQLVWLAIAPVFFLYEPRRRTASPENPSDGRIFQRVSSLDWALSLAIGLSGVGVNALVGLPMEELPPAYHDEYSYLFQAKTLLAGRFSYPSPSVHPDVFQQMHILNEGRMGSRYYPGTGAWLAPFVAVGHPYWGHWLASGLVAMFLYWTGRELSGRLAGAVAGLTCAASPGVALFGNLLLAHQPTLFGLALLLFGMTRWRRTRSGWDALLAGSGLGLAMLCRPMTAASVALPFGIDVLWWLIRGYQHGGHQTASPTGDSVSNQPNPKPFAWNKTLLGLGLPLVIGWGVMFAYHKDLTGNWLTSPYQVYTDLHTPRHVYGFNNRVRGERHLGPKVIAHYDEWAENLTLPKSLENGLTRWVASSLWTLDPLVLLLVTVAIGSMLARCSAGWKLVVASLLCLHLAHIPYWYVGIMGWHYVFESASLWCLLLGCVTGALFDLGRRAYRPGLIIWWLVLVLFSALANHVSVGGAWEPKIARGRNVIAHPRREQAKITRWLEASVPKRPALVLFPTTAMERSHLDFVTNDPGLTSSLVRGRYPKGDPDTAMAAARQIARDFPDRTVYLADPERMTLDLITP